MQIVTNDMYYSAEHQAIVAMKPSAEIMSAPLDPTKIGKIELVPWGKDNDQPFKVLEAINKSETVSTNLQFNINAGYGLGIKPYFKEVGADGVATFKDCDNEEVLNFFENNDLDGYFLEQLADLATFYNVFPEIILSEDGTKITSLRSLEAAFSRWGVVNKGRITTHYYHHDWADAKEKEITTTPVLPRFDTLAALEREAAASPKNRRFVLHLSMPTPGRTYYARPWWWSIFESGWFDLSTMIPIFKKALLKNHLAVRYIVYVHEEYWTELAKSSGINRSDTEKFEAMRQAGATKIMDFLKNEDGKGGGLVTGQKTSLTASSKDVNSKYIEVVPIKPEIEGGEFIEDAEEANNIICYAMSVHPSLIGATPGKASGSLGGSDKRELFMIKQAMMKPSRDRLLKPLHLIKRFNNWPENLVFGVPEYQFPTLDVAKEGVKQTTQNSK